MSDPARGGGHKWRTRRKLRQLKKSVYKLQKEKNNKTEPPTRARDGKQTDRHVQEQLRSVFMGHMAPVMCGANKQVIKTAFRKLPL